MNQWLGDGWVDGWMDGWACYFSCWAISSLNDLFAEAPLLSATSCFSPGLPPNYIALLQHPQPNSSLRAGVTMCLAASSCNPAWHTRSTMVKNYLSCSYYDAFSNFQLQSCLPGASQHHSYFAARSRSNAFLSQGVANQQSRSVTTKSTNVRAELAMGTVPRYSDHGSLLWNRALATVRCTFCRPRLPKVLQTWQFFAILKCKSCSHYSPVRFLLATFADRGLPPETGTLLPRPQRPHYPKKNTVFHRWIHTLPNSYTSQDDGCLKWWWCGWHDDMGLTWWYGVDMMRWLTWWWEC